MPVARFQMPDGRIGRFEVPEGTTPEQAQAMIAAQVGGRERTPDALDNPNMATEGMSGPQKFLAGAGKAFTDLGRGVGQITGMIPQADIDAAKAQDVPLMNTGAGMAGNIVGNVAATLPALGIPGANTYTGAAALGGVMGALQPTAEGESRGFNAGIGAAGGLAGQGIGNAMAKALRPVQSSLNPEMQRLVQVAAKEGIPLDAAAQTGSKPLQVANAVFENLPFTAGSQAAQNSARQQAFTAAALKRAGIAGVEATPDVLANQKRALGTTFETIAGRNALDFNGGLGYDLQVIADTASRRLPNGGMAIKNTVDDILNEAPQGIMQGSKYQGWRSELGRLAKGNDSEAHYFGQIKKALDSEFNTQVPALDAEAWKKASREYANLKTILQSMGGSGNAAQAGNIAPTQLAAALRQSVGTEGKALGRGDLNDLSRVGNLFVRDQVQNSGTAQRQLIQSLLTGGGGAGIGAIGAGATGQDPLRGAAYGAGVGAASLLTPKIAQALMQNPVVQSYMIQQAQSPVAKAMALALQNGGRSVGAAAVPAIYGGQ